MARAEDDAELLVEGPALSGDDTLTLAVEQDVEVGAMRYFAPPSSSSMLQIWTWQSGM